MTSYPIKKFMNTQYKCPKCNGIIQKVIYDFETHTFYRWTCSKCQRDYGYNTEKPLSYKT
jgi:transposase-like protein